MISRWWLVLVVLLWAPSLYGQEASDVATNTAYVRRPEASLRSGAALKRGDVLALTLQVEGAPTPEGSRASASVGSRVLMPNMQTSLGAFFRVGALSAAWPLELGLVAGLAPRQVAGAVHDDTFGLDERNLGTSVGWLGPLLRLNYQPDTSALQLAMIGEFVLTSVPVARRPVGSAPQESVEVTWSAQLDLQVGADLGRFVLGYLTFGVGAYPSIDAAGGVDADDALDRFLGLRLGTGLSFRYQDFLADGAILWPFSGDDVAFGAGFALKLGWVF